MNGRAESKPRRYGLVATHADQGSRPLEIDSFYPQGEPRGAPLLFVHGAFCGAWVWSEYFLPHFARNGYAAHALSLRGHGDTKGQAHTGTRLADYVADLREAVASLPRPPVLIGHSMGGVVVQRYLNAHRMPGAVLMASGPPHGMWLASVWMLLRNPLIYGQICMLQTPGPRPASVDLLRKAVFSKSMPRNQALGFLGRMQDEPISVALELMWPFVPKRHDTPLLVLGAEEDYFVSPALVRATAASYGTQADILPGIGHAMMLDTRWEEAAKRIQRWLETSAATA